MASNRKLDEALQLAQAAYRERPEDPAISDTLGWAYFRKNLVKEAIPHLEASVQKAPKDAMFQFHLGMAYVQTGAWANGRRALKAALSLSPNFAGVEEARKALAMIGDSG